MKSFLKRFRYFAAVMMATFVACSGLMALAPNTASAASGRFELLETAHARAVIWSEYLAAISGDKCDFMNSTPEITISKGDWFYANSADIKLGYHVNPGDGDLKCANENGWFSHLLNVTLGSSTDYITPAKQVFDFQTDGKYHKRDDSLARLKAFLDDGLFGGNPPSSTPKDVGYAILYENFVAGNACNAKAIANPNEQATYDDDKVFNIWVADAGPPAAARQALYGYKDNKTIKVGPGIFTDDEAHCEAIGNFLKDKSWADGAVAYTTTTGNGLADNSSSTASDDPNIDCGASITDLSWWACPLIKGVNTIIGGLDDAINSFLTVDQVEIFDRTTDTGAAYYAAWQAFRGIALGVLVIASLVMIIAQAFGFEFLDAYTIKKLLPRLLIAIIGIALSWDLMNFFVGFTNDLGLGIRQIIYYPFKEINDGLTLGGGSIVLLSLLTGGAVLGLGILALLSFGLTAALGLFIAFLVLIIRQLVIVVLILFAPIAIACYILPNTNNVWKLWYESFSKALLMFPIIVAFLAVGRVFALTATADEAGVGGVGAISQLVGLAAYILPYFLIPLTFRFAGGALRTIGGFANDRGKGSFDRLKKYRQGKAASNWANTKAGHRFRGEGAIRDRLNSGLQTATLLPDARMNPTKMRSRIRSARSARTSALSAEVEKSAAARQVIGNDDLLAAALNGNGRESDARSYLQGLGQSGNELSQNVASIMQAKNDVGKSAFEDFAAANLAGTGTGYRSGPAEMLETIARVSGNDAARSARILNSARGQAERAKRVDLYGAGFATSADMLAQVRSGSYNRDHINEVMTDEALNTKMSGEVAGSRKGGLSNMTGAMIRRLQKADNAVTVARASGDASAIQIAEHEQKRVLASTAALHDDAGRLSPENSQIIGAVLGQLTGNKVNAPMVTTDRDGNATYVIDPGTGRPVMSARAETVGDQIESLRGDREFQQYRREYSSGREAAAMGGAPPIAGTPPPAE